MSHAVRFLYYLSLVFLLATLFFGYYQYPEFVKIGINPSTGLDDLIAKTYLFYGGAVVFFIVNVIFLVIANLLSSFPVQHLPFPNKPYWICSLERREYVSGFFVTWVRSWVTLVNIMMALVYLFLWFVNNLESGDIVFYGLIIQYLIFALLIWWVFIPIRFMIKNADNLDEE